MKGEKVVDLDVTSSANDPQHALDGDLVPVSPEESRREPQRTHPLGPSPLQADPKGPSRLDHHQRAERLLYGLTLLWIVLCGLGGLTVLWWLVG